MAAKTFATNEMEFRVHVVESLARLETLAATADVHLAYLKKGIANQEDRLETLRVFFAEHRYSCPMRKELEELKISLVADEAKGQASAKWWERASPLIWLAIGGLIVLFLIHADAMLKAFAR